MRMIFRNISRKKEKKITEVSRFGFKETETDKFWNDLQTETDIGKMQSLPFVNYSDSQLVSAIVYWSKDLEEYKKQYPQADTFQEGRLRGILNEIIKEQERRAKGGKWQPYISREGDSNSWKIPESWGVIPE